MANFIKVRNKVINTDLITDAVYHKATDESPSRLVIFQAAGGGEEQASLLLNAKEADGVWDILVAIADAEAWDRTTSSPLLDDDNTPASSATEAQ